MRRQRIDMVVFLENFVPNGGAMVLQSKYLPKFAAFVSFIGA
jgi:hypothetical protein